MVIIAKPTHKRYAHKKSYEAFKEGVSLGYFIFERKLTEEELIKELLKVKKLTGADKIVLHWSARDGFVDKEVEL